MSASDAPPPVETMSHLTEAHIKDTPSPPQIKELDASQVTITKTTTLRPVPEPNSKEVWGAKSCSDHMVSVKWTADEGWHTPEIKPVRKDICSKCYLEADWHQLTESSMGL